MPVPISALLSEQALDQLAARLTRLPDPDAILSRIGLRRCDLRVLEGDDEIATALETRREAVVTTPWRLEPYEGNPAAEWIWAELQDHLPALIRGAWQAVPYGYAVQEVIWRRADGGRLGLGRIDEKPMEWFEPTRDGRLLYFPASGQPTEVDAREKFLLTRRLPTYRQPFGEALLSRLYWPWFFRSNGWQFWARFVERHGAPLLVGRTKQTDAMLAALSAAVQSAVLAVDRDDEVTAVAPANAGEAFAGFSAAVDRRIQKTILGQTLTTDVGASGSFAAAKVHDDVRDDRRRADCALVAGTVQRLVDALCRRNFPGAEIPQFIFADDAGLEAERAQRDATLVQAGILTLSEAYLLDRYDFEPGDFAVVAASAATPTGRSVAAASAPTGAQLAAAPAPRFSRGQQAVEGLVDATLSEAAPLGGPIPPAQIRAAIAAARGPADLERRLARLVTGGAWEAGAWRELVERALFAADVLGYVAADAEEGRD